MGSQGRSGTVSEFTSGAGPFFLGGVVAAATKAEIIHHVGYEWWMFRCAWEFTDTMTIPDPVRNAEVESLFIHGRVLIEFFCNKPNKQKYPDDWSCIDLGIIRHKKIGVLRTLYDRTNKRVAHLTATRETQLQAWKDANAKTALAAFIADLETKCAADLPRNWIGTRSTASVYTTATPIGPQGTDLPLINPSSGATAGHQSHANATKITL